jgi:predicted nucleotidyltransferase
MAHESLHFGLDASTINKIQTVLAQYPEVEKAVIYGSRAKGNYKPGSDIDLSLLGNKLTEERLLRLENQLDDLMLPYQLDLNRFHSLQNRALIDHIERVGKVFYLRDRAP